MGPPASQVMTHQRASSSWYPEEIIPLTVKAVIRGMLRPSGPERRVISRTVSPTSAPMDAARFSPNSISRPASGLETPATVLR